MFLNVGRAVKLRNRLQAHAFGSVTKQASPWIQEFMESPHSHMIRVSIWYVPKEQLSIAEAFLIDNLKPTQNKRDIGYGGHKYWAFREPDVIDADLEEIEPDRHRKNGRASASRVRNESGVYAWWIDSGLEIYSIYKLIAPSRRPFSYKEVSFRRVIAARLSASRQRSRQRP